jgi:hypothetical protein
MLSEYLDPRFYGKENASFEWTITWAAVVLGRRKESSRKSWLMARPVATRRARKNRKCKPYPQGDRPAHQYTRAARFRGAGRG